MTLNQAIDRYTNNAEYERIHGSLQGCLEFRQLAEWLKDYKRLLEQEPTEDMPCVSREEMQKCKDIVKKYTPKQEPSDTVSRGVFEQVMWERDVAIEQLKELGYELGQKVEPYDDVVSREAAIKAIRKSTKKYSGFMEMEQYTDEDAIEAIKSLPSVTPQQKSGKMLICPSCNLDVHSDFTRCPRCGAKMVEPQESEE